MPGRRKRNREDLGGVDWPGLAVNRYPKLRDLLALAVQPEDRSRFLNFRRLALALQQSPLKYSSTEIRRAMKELRQVAEEKRLRRLVCRLRGWKRRVAEVLMSEEGLLAKQIARRLCTNEQTVKDAVTDLRKLGMPITNPWGQKGYSLQRKQRS